MAKAATVMSTVAGPAGCEVGREGGGLRIGAAVAASAVWQVHAPLYRGFRYYADIGLDAPGALEGPQGPSGSPTNVNPASQSCTLSHSVT